MISLIKKMFAEAGEKNSTGNLGHREVIVASCAMFVEMASIDGEFDADEQKHVLDVLVKTHDLTPNEAQEILAEARHEQQNSVDVWQFAKLLNTRLQPQQKIQVVEELWKIVLVDGHLDKHEEYLARRLCDLLNLPHSEFIKAKLAAMRKA